MLTLRCENGGSTENLDLSIELLEAAPASAVDQREAMDSTLVQALRHRLTATADSADLDRVIECCEVGVAAAPVDGEGAVKWLIGLGDALLNRFERVGADSDLDQATDAMRRALDADPARQHPVGGHAGSVNGSREATGVEKPVESPATSGGDGRLSG